MVGEGGDEGKGRSLPKPFPLAASFLLFLVSFYSTDGVSAENIIMAEPSPKRFKANASDRAPLKCDICGDDLPLDVPDYEVRYAKDGTRYNMHPNCYTSQAGTRFIMQRRCHFRCRPIF